MEMLKFVVLENINWFWLLVGCLAAWRLTNVIHWEGIAEPIRRRFGAVEDEEGNIKYKPLHLFGKQITFFAELLSCFWCLSVWVSFGVFVLILVFPWVLLPFAISAVAIIIERTWDK